MTSTSSINQDRISNQYPVNYGFNAKTLSTAPSNKALGTDSNGTPETPESWKEANQGAWDLIQSGGVPTYDNGAAWSDSDIATFTDYWNYNEQQLGTSWDPSMGGSNDASSDASGATQEDPAAPSLPEGAELGTMGNVTWTNPTSEATFTGDPRAQDVWSDDFTLDVSKVSANVTVEKTSDTRMTPAEDVLKITVTDKATGLSTTYFVHDYQNAKVKINTASTNQVPTSSTIDELTNSGILTLGQYTAPSADGTGTEETPPSYSGGEVEHEEGSDQWTHTGKVGEPMEFSPQDTGTEEFHDIWGEANITLNADQSARIDWISPDHSTHYITVYNREGKAIARYEVHAGNPVNLNANVNQITEGDEGSDIPIKDFDASGGSEFWITDLSINGDKATSVANGKDGSQPADVPDYLKDFAKAFSPDLSDDEVQALLTDDKYSDMLKEIKYGSSEFPSKQLLEYMKAHDDELKFHMDQKDDDATANRLAELLKAAGYDVDNNTKDNAVLKINGTSYDISVDKNGNLNWDTHD